MAPMFCPHCGEQLLLAGQKFCAYCAGDLSVLAGSERPALPSRRQVTRSDIPPTADAQTRDDVAFDGGPIDFDSPNPRTLLEAGAAGLASIALLLPIATVAVTSSYVPSTASASVSVLDLIQHTSWTQWLELDLIVFGTVGIAPL
jgi:zinc-ribbon domain